MADHEEMHHKGGRGGKKGVRKAPANPMNLWMVNTDDCDDGWWPDLRPTSAIPERLVTFMVADSHEHSEDFCHFFIDDYRFERIWAQPENYLRVIKRYRGAIAPDFSTYIDMPRPMQMWNVYRSRAMAHYWQQQGIDVVPLIQFSDESSYGWIFDGLPRHSVLATSSVGVYRNPEYREAFSRGMEVACKLLEPRDLIWYGYVPDGVDVNGARIHHYDNDNDVRMRANRERRKRMGDG